MGRRRSWVQSAIAGRSPFAAIMRSATGIQCSREPRPTWVRGTGSSYPRGYVERGTHTHINTGNGELIPTWVRGTVNGTSSPRVGGPAHAPACASPAPSTTRSVLERAAAAELDGREIARVVQGARHALRAAARLGVGPPPRRLGEHGVVVTSRVQSAIAGRSLFGAIMRSAVGVRGSRSSYPRGYVERNCELMPTWVRGTERAITYPRGYAERNGRVIPTWVRRIETASSYPRGYAEPLRRNGRVRTRTDGRIAASDLARPRNRASSAERAISYPRGYARWIQRNGRAHTRVGTRARYVERTISYPRGYARSIRWNGRSHTHVGTWNGVVSSHPC